MRIIQLPKVAVCLALACLAASPSISMAGDRHFRHSDGNSIIFTTQKHFDRHGTCPPRRSRFDFYHKPYIYGPAIVYERPFSRPHHRRHDFHRRHDDHRDRKHHGDHRRHEHEHF